MKTETRIMETGRDYEGNRTVYCRGNKATLQAGSSDYISLHYYDKDHTLVLSINKRIGYIGAELIELATMEVVSDVFIQNASEDGIDLDKSYCYLADTMAQYINN